MTVSRVEYKAGHANLYNEIGQNVRSFPCLSIIGYGPKGVVTNINGGLVRIYDVNCRQETMSKVVFEKRKWELHDDYLQVRC